MMSQASKVQRIETGGTPARHTNPVAIASFVMAILGYTPVLVPSLLAIVLGFAALSTISRSGERGRRLAIVSIWLGFVGVAWTVYFVLTIALPFTMGRGN